MQLDETVSSLDDPRIAVYRDLKHANQSRPVVFIVEGENLVHRLLRSDFQIQSVLVSERRLDSVRPFVRPGYPVLVAKHELVSDIVGYKFHSGVLGCGYRKANPNLGCFEPLLSDGIQTTVVACSRVDNPDNVGTILRTCSAFGAALVLLGEGCPDPYSRRVLRVSMGEAFWLPIRVSGNLAEDLLQLRDRWGFTLIATDLAADSTELGVVPPCQRTVLVLGNEAHGLERDLVDFCDRKVRIPMANRVDSLNVAIACGILLYHFTGLPSLPDKLA